MDLLNFGSIQSIEQGYGYTPLVLNPSGGYVSVNTALPPSYPLDVDGAICSSLGYHMPTSGGIGAILNYNDENTAFSSTVVWSTYTSASVSCTFSQTSNKVIFMINTITLTPSTSMSGSPTFNTTLPFNYIPNVDYHGFVLLNLGGYWQPGFISIDTSGGVSFGLCAETTLVLITGTSCYIYSTFFAYTIFLITKKKTSEIRIIVMKKLKRSWEFPMIK